MRFCYKTERTQHTIKDFIAILKQQHKYFLNVSVPLIHRQKLSDS